MSMHLEVESLDLANEPRGASEILEADDRVEPSDLVHFLEDVSTFLAHRDQPA